MGRTLQFGVDSIELAEWQPFCIFNYILRMTEVNPDTGFGSKAMSILKPCADMDHNHHM